MANASILAKKQEVIDEIKSRITDSKGIVFSL